MPTAQRRVEDGRMGKTQFYTATSIDGFIADTKNSLDWLFESGTPDEPGNQGFPAFFTQVGAFCMGATTYEWILDHDQLLSNPDKWKQYYGDVPCWVFAHRSLPAIQGANLHFVSGDVVPVHDEMLKAAAGRNIWVVGGGELAGMFADRGRLDELILGIAPVTLGAGAPLLPRRITSSRLTLEKAEKQGQFIAATYSLRAA
jgi:dihydrofolate reductase